MGFWSAVKSWGRGEGKQGLDYLFVDEDVINTDIETTRKLDQLNKDQVADYSITEQEYRERLARLTNTAFPDFINDTGERGAIFTHPELSPAAGVEEGIEEGWDNVKEWPQKITNGALGLTWKLIPWQLWLALGVYLLFITAPLWLPLFAGRVLAGKK